LFISFLIVSIYITIIVESLLDDSYIVVRYLHFSYVALLIFSSLLFLYLLLTKSKKLLWLAPGLLFVIVSYLLPFITNISSNDSLEKLVPTSTPPIKVISFSVNSRNKDYRQVAQLLSNNPADIICLQEIPFSRYALFMTEMKQAGLNYHHVYSKNKALMILAKDPITPHKTMPFLQASVNLNGHLIKIWNLHAPKSLKKMNYQHFYFDKLYEDVNSDKTEYKLVCGDFNSTPHNNILPLFMNTLQPAYKQSPNPISLTYPTVKGIVPSPVPLIKIDYLLFSRNFKIDHYQRIAQYANSDHYPISARVSLMKKAEVQTQTTQAKH